jgi:hypothetical protein
MANNTRPFQQGGTPTPEQFEAFGKLAQMLKGARGEQEYTPVLKALKSIGVEPAIMTVMIKDEPIECVVIPVDELRNKEWLHMSGQKQPQGEGR